jgi:hypothetical protein
LFFNYINSQKKGIVCVFAALKKSRKNIADLVEPEHVTAADGGEWRGH